MSTYYVLDENKNVVAESDLKKWSAFFEDFDNRRIDETITRGIRISTVFLGMDHNWGEGDPLVFETMAFAQMSGTDDLSEICGEFFNRYSTYADALEGHAKIVAEVESRFV